MKTILFIFFTVYTFPLWAEAGKNSNITVLYELVQKQSSDNMGPDQFWAHSFPEIKDSYNMAIESLSTYVRITESGENIIDEIKILYTFFAKGETVKSLMISDFLKRIYMRCVVIQVLKNELKSSDVDTGFSELTPDKIVALSEKPFVENADLNSAVFNLWSSKGYGNLDLGPHPMAAVFRSEVVLMPPSKIVEQNHIVGASFRMISSELIRGYSLKLFLAFMDKNGDIQRLKDEGQPYLNTLFTERELKMYSFSFFGIRKGTVEAIYSVLNFKEDAQEASFDKNAQESSWLHDLQK